MSGSLPVGLILLLFASLVTPVFSQQQGKPSKLPEIKPKGPMCHLAART